MAKLTKSYIRDARQTKEKKNKMIQYFVGVNQMCTCLCNTNKYSDSSSNETRNKQIIRNWIKERAKRSQKHAIFRLFTEKNFPRSKFLNGMH